MKKSYFFQILAILVLLSTGCAKMPVRGDYTVLETPPTVEADAESGIIYFLRESSFIGGGVTYYIWEDTNKIGLLRSGSYFIHKAPVGLHTYWAETEAKTTLSVSIEPGKVYYVVGGVSMGALIGRATLEQITEPLAKQLLPKLKYTRLSTLEEAEAYKKKSLE